MARQGKADKNFRAAGYVLAASIGPSRPCRGGAGKAELGMIKIMAINAFTFQVFIIIVFFFGFNLHFGFRKVCQRF